MVPFSSTLALARELGPQTLAAWLLYQAQLRGGLLRRRTPLKPWKAFSLAQVLAPQIPCDPQAYLNWRHEHQPSFFFDPLEGPSLSLGDGEKQRAIREAESILAGRFPLFGDHWFKLGFPPDFNRFPPGVAGEGERVGAECHWSLYDLGKLPGDVKFLWEPSRWGWVYFLVRAYRLSGQARFAQGCARLMGSWRDQNPPNGGVQWYSAQEVAIRLLALCFGAYGLWPWLGERPAAWAQLVESVAAHAQRIPPSMAYARAQRNNHLLLEAVGLYSAGLLFPELRGAARWKAQGRRWLERALEDQILPDGGYVQHSTNYHRLMLQAALWAARLAEGHGEPLAARLQSRLRKAAEWLEALLDPNTGQAPNWGHNDGALLFPFGAQSFSDHRPTAQAAWRAWLGAPCYPRGAWDELSHWLGLENGAAASSGAKPETRLDFRRVGLYRFAQGELRGLLRCAWFTRRPAHADQLHVDLWWGGLNVALDPGTYLYQGPAPWQNGLASAAVHNGPWVDGQEPMRRVGKFLWSNWAQGKFLGRWLDPSGRLELLVAEHYGYGRLGVVLRRAILCASEGLCLVVDDVLGGGPHRVRVGWTLPDLDYRLQDDAIVLRAAGGQFGLRLEPRGDPISLYRGGQRASGPALRGETRLLGWSSPNYGRRQAALFAAREVEGETPMRLISWWSFDPAAAQALEVDWNPPRADGLPIRRVRLGERVLQV